MAYATLQDMIDRFGETELAQLSDRTNAAASIDTAVIDAKLPDADAEIDGYLVQRYTLPLASVPPVLKRIATDLARYHLYDDRSTEQVTKRYDDAIAFLKDVAKGVAGIGVDPGGDPPGESASPDYIANDPVFNRCTLKDFLG